MKIQEYTWANNSLLQRISTFIGTICGTSHLFITDIEEEFELAYSEGRVYEYHSNGSSLSYFKTKYRTADENKPIWLHMAKNMKCDKPNDYQNWKGLFATTEDELLDKLISFDHIHASNILFDSMSDLNYFLKQVSEKAMPEKWDYSDYKSVISFPILKSYIENTFSKLQKEFIQHKNKGLPTDRCAPIVHYKDRVYFNSGLLDRFFNQIILVTEPGTEILNIPGFEGHVYSWYKNIKCYSHNEYEISKDFNEDDLPTLASYFDNVEDMIFDSSLQINLNDSHIFIDGLERGRIPKYREQYEHCKYDEEKKRILVNNVIKDFTAAISHVQRMAKRNYKLAVPQYWCETGEIQFLLPIYLSNSLSEDTKPQCAIALKCDNSGRIINYRGATVLTMDMAYQNARLIAKPDTYWLKPMSNL